MDNHSHDDKRRAESTAVLERSIQDGLRYVIGESGLEMILKDHPLETLSSDVAGFHAVLVEIFKENGAALIEREIAGRLLDGAGRQRGPSGLPGHSSGLSSAGRPPRMSRDDARALRQLVQLAIAPRGRHGGSSQSILVGEGTSSSIETTSLAFADAFKKGS
jgi:hypothetical protein